MSSMTVTLQCPVCDDGRITATVSPQSIDEAEDAGCGHAAQIYTREGAAVWKKIVDAIWKAVEEDSIGRYEDEMESRGDRLRDGG